MTEHKQLKNQIRKTVNLTDKAVAYLLRLGNGNLSAGVRQCVQMAMLADAKESGE